MLNVILSELLFGNMGAAIPTYVRNDNADAAYQVDSSNSVTSEKRLIGLIERNRGNRKRTNGRARGISRGIYILQMD